MATQPAWLSRARCRYAQLEAARLREELEAVALPILREEATEVVVGKLRSAVPTAVARCQEAMERCWQCSLGTELPALGQAVDQALAGFIDRLTVKMPEGCEVGESQRKAWILAGWHAGGSTGKQCSAAVWQPVCF